MLKLTQSLSLLPLCVPIAATDVKGTSSAIYLHDRVGNSPRDGQIASHLFPGRMVSLQSLEGRAVGRGDNEDALTMIVQRHTAQPQHGRALQVPTFGGREIIANAQSLPLLAVTTMFGSCSSVPERVVKQTWCCSTRRRWSTILYGVDRY